jgi:hypothetical protein
MIVSPLYLASEKFKILSWLVTVNPSPNHNQALELCHDGTCEWVFKSNQWIEWMRRVEHTSPDLSRGLWIHGIPGAGKTVLAAFLAQKIWKERKLRTMVPESELPTASVYYYCYHGRNHEETGPFLRWLLSQLCRRADFVPPAIRTLFEIDCQPGTTELIEAIKLVAVQFSRVLVSIDAVDESQNREALAGVLRQLTDAHLCGFEQFYLIVTSRREADLEYHLAEYIQVSMSNSWVDKDINNYIDGWLTSSRICQLWSPALQKDVRKALSTGAQGMQVVSIPDGFYLR